MNPSQLTHLPFDEFPGRIYRCPMPFGMYDPEGLVLDEMKQNGISVIVMLATGVEAQRKAGRDLRELYRAEGIEVIHLPIQDFSVPERAALDRAIDEAVARARQGQNIAVHCSAGIGRTGLFLVELTKKVKGLPGKDALSWVREYVSGAVETPEQVEFVLQEP